MCPAPHHPHVHAMIALCCLFARVKGCICVVTISLARTQKGTFTEVKGCIYLSREFRCGRKLGGCVGKIHVIVSSLLGASLLWDMPSKKSKAKAAVQAPGDPHPLPKPAPSPRTTHEPTKEVVDEYVKVVGVENVAGTSIQVSDCALSVNEIMGLPAIPEDVCLVRERLQKLQQENSEPLKYLVSPVPASLGPSRRHG